MIIALDGTLWGSLGLTVGLTTSLWMLCGSVALTWKMGKSLWDDYKKKKDIT